MYKKVVHMKKGIEEIIEKRAKEIIAIRRKNIDTNILLQKPKK